MLQCFSRLYHSCAPSLILDKQQVCKILSKWEDHDTAYFFKKQKLSLLLTQFETFVRLAVWDEEDCKTALLLNLPPYSGYSLNPVKNQAVLIHVDTVGLLAYCCS